MDPRYISISIAQAGCGLTKWGWKQLVKQTGLPVYRLPGDAFVVEGTALDVAIDKLREELDPASARKERSV